MISPRVFSKEITLQEAVNWGLKNNPSLQELEYNLTKTERELAKIKAGFAWQVDFSGSTLYQQDTDLVLNQFGFTEETKEKGKNLKIGLQGTKLFSSGLTLENNIILNDKLSSIKSENLEDKVDYNLKVTQPIYPINPVELEQEYKKSYNEFLKIKNNLEWQQGIKKIDWLEGYLNILRLKESLDIAKENYDFSKDYLNKILKKQSIKEAGEQQVLIAKIDLKKAEFNLAQNNNKFIEEQQEWLEELGLSRDSQIVLSEDAKYLNNNKEKIYLLKVDQYSKGNLIERIKNCNPKVNSNKLELDLTKKEFKWEKNKNRAKLNLVANYNRLEEEWSIGVNLTQNLFDGGKEELINLDYKDDLDKLENDFQNLMKSLTLKLDKFINKLEEARVNFQEKKLTLDKAKLEKRLLQKQLQDGVITAREFKQKNIELEEALVDFKSAKDQIIISKLRLFYFVGMIKL
ncbi:Outer membrane protein TolC [Orenia metallireducens]|uniref:Outer membrane protein TolC n=2 Tax=Orenia metallireducens TaxID=1413210 RepID=A0A285IBW9_9FIRM|nr:Outer membrane protein TolC [Orenia metallireducens]